MKINVTLLLLLLVSLVSAQDTTFIKTQDSYKDTLRIDTLTSFSPFGRNILVGTAHLPSTHNQMSAKSYNINLRKIEKSDCISSGIEGKRINNKINYIESTDTSMIVDINISDNCCYDFICDISVNEEGILNLMYYGYGNYCACNCCYGLKYIFSKTDFADREKLSGVIINNNSTTFKLIPSIK